METITPQTVNEETEDVVVDFEEALLKRIASDWENAKQYMDPFHRWCLDMHGFYYNSQNYASLKKQNKFPSTAIQEDVDQFVADVRDKLFYAGRPSTLVGREDTDEADSDAKQDMLDYQDEQDEIFNKVGLAIRDAALYRICISKIDYTKRTKRRWSAVDIPAIAKDGYGDPIIDESGMPVQLRDEQGKPVPSGEKQWQLTDVVDYEGATVERLDPVNVFWTADKDKMTDGYPIMVRSMRDAAFFKSEPYFFNSQKVLENPPGNYDKNDPINVKRGHTAESPNSGTMHRGYEYVEWYGTVDRLELYKYFLANPGKDPNFNPAKIQEILPDEKVWIIAGFVGDKTLVQCREEPFDLGRPNIVIGYMSEGEDSLIGVSLSQKIEAVQRAEEDVNGMLMEAFKRTVNPWNIIDITKVVDPKPIVNSSGIVLKTNSDPNRVVKTQEMPPVARDIYIQLDRFRRIRQNQGGLHDILTGKGDANAETLGEVNTVASSASLRMRDYLKSFENSYIRPLYEIRNHINATLIDHPYAYRVVGEKAKAWRKIEPATIRTSVDFICESSARETNRAIIVQQMLQFIQIAPLAFQAGQIVRFDKMMAELGRTGFNISEDKIQDWFPFIRLEEEAGINIDELLLQNALAGMAMGGMVPPGGPGGGGGNLPQPTSEEDAVVANNKRNETQVGRT